MKIAWYLLKRAPPHAIPTQIQGLSRPARDSSRATLNRSIVSSQKNNNGPSGKAKVEAASP